MEDYIAEHPGVSVPPNKTKSMGYNQRFVGLAPEGRSSPQKPPEAAD